MDQRNIDRVAASGRILYSLDGVVLHDTLYNISAEGCMIETEHSLATVDKRIELTLLQGVTVSGTVAWSKPGGFGVRFDKRISEATVRYFRLTDWAEPEIGEPTDGFGRVLPPLSGFSLRAARA